MFLQLQKQFKVHSQPVTVLGKLYLWSVPVPFLLLTLYLRRSLFLRLFIFTFLWPCGCQRTAVGIPPLLHRVGLRLAAGILTC